MTTNPQKESAQVLGVAAAGAVYLGGVALSTWHGFYRHNESVGWALAWGVAATLIPVLTPVVALGQGLGVKPRNRKRYRRCL